MFSYVQENSKRFDWSIIIGCRIIYNSSSCHDVFIWNGKAAPISLVGYLFKVLNFDCLENEWWSFFSINACFGPVWMCNLFLFLNFLLEFPLFSFFSIIFFIEIFLWLMYLIMSIFTIIFSFFLFPFSVICFGTLLLNLVIVTFLYIWWYLRWSFCRNWIVIWPSAPLHLLLLTRVLMGTSYVLNLI